MKRFLLIIIVALLFGENAWADNSKFYGQFNVSYHAEYSGCLEPDEDGSGIFTIGNDFASISENYFYIPINSTSSSYSYFTEYDETHNVNLLVSGSSLIFEKRESDGDIEYWTINFLNNYNNLTFYVNEVDSKPIEECSSVITGSGPRILTKPSTPIHSSPANGSKNVTLTPMLKTRSFSDPDEGDTHLQTEWVISTSSDFSSSILYESSTSNLTSLTVPASVLQGNTRYYWRVKFYDNRETASDWSSAFSFTTEQTFTDLNENGIPDDLENNTVDIDEDGIADIEQTNEIKTLDTIIGSGQMGVSIKESTTVTETVEINSIDPDDISEYVRPHTMPLGMLSFKLNVTNPGDTANVKVYFSEAAPENASWLFYDSINGWTDYSQYATFSEDRMSASVQLKDGGHGDSDGVANGIIVDPCGFGIASWIKGKVTDSATSEGLAKGILTLADIDFTLSTLSDGTYISMLLPGTYDIDVSLSGYQTESLSDIMIPEADIVTKDIKLSGRCKINGAGITGTPSITSPVTFQVNAQSGSDTINYRYSVHDGYGTEAYDGTNWTSMTDSEYQTENSCDYTFGSSGKSIVVAWATSSDTDNIDQTGIPIIGWSVDTSDSVCTTNFTGVIITGEQKVNEKMTFAVSAVNSCDKNKYYRFSMHPYYGTDDYDDTHWESMTSQEWISSNSADYTFTEAGKYVIVVWVTDDINNYEADGIPIIGWSVDIE